MYPSADARQLSVLLRTSRALDIVGDASVRVDYPSELLAWANLLPEPRILAWRATDSAKRYANVTAWHRRTPIHGQVTVVLPCDQHLEFWKELLGRDDLEPGDEQDLDLGTLSGAWAAMPDDPTV